MFKYKLCTVLYQLLGEGLYQPLHPKVSIYSVKSFFICDKPGINSKLCSLHVSINWVMGKIPVQSIPDCPFLKLVPRLNFLT